MKSYKIKICKKFLFFVLLLQAVGNIFVITCNNFKLNRV